MGKILNFDTVFGNQAHPQCFIKRYSVWYYLLSRDWVGLKWRPVLKVWEQLHDNHSNCYVKYSPDFHYFSSQSCKSNAKFSILYFFFLLSFLFLFFSITHNSKSVRPTRMILTPNECTSFRDRGGFPIRHFVHNYMHNLKTKGHIGLFTS